MMFIVISTLSKIRNRLAPRPAWGLFLYFRKLLIGIKTLLEHPRESHADAYRYRRQYRRAAVIPKTGFLYVFNPSATCEEYLSLHHQQIM